MVGLSSWSISRECNSVKEIAGVSPLQIFLYILKFLCYTNLRKAVRYEKSVIVLSFTGIDIISYVLCGELVWRHD